MAAAEPAEWRRVHPLSPLLRAGRVVLVAIAVSIDAAAEFVVSNHPAVILLALLGLLVVAALYSWLAWRVTAYRIGSDELELRSGIVFRSHRRVPIARVESVDIARPIVARVLGLAQVRVEAVSQGATEVRLSYLEEHEAAAVRDEIAARQRGAAPAADAAAVADPTAPPSFRPIVRVPTMELIVGIAGARIAFLLVLLVIAVVVAAFVGVAEVLGIAAVGFLGIATLVVASAAEIERLYGFTLAEGDDGLHIQRGLLNELHQRVAPGRVQAVEIIEPMLWRPFHRVQVVVDIAGYRGGQREQQRATAVLLPVAPRAVADYVLARIVPGLALHEVQFERPPAAARRRAPLRWRSYGAAWTAQHAIVCGGLWRRHTEIVPHHKVQSARITEGPWQRALGLATLHLDTAGSNVRAQAVHFARADAERLAWASRALAP